MMSWPIKRARVSGDSMAPTYRDGDLIWVRIFASVPNEIRLGTVVLIERDAQPGVLYVKRVQRAHGGAFWVEGDNPDPDALTRISDSRRWGYIPAHEIKGRALYARRQRKL